jgi:hypothetical protein
MGKKRAKIDAPRAWGYIVDGKLCHSTETYRWAFPVEYRTVAVRIIREADYRRLLAAAKRGHK